MKNNNNQLKWFLSLLSMLLAGAWLTGCGGDGTSGTNTGANGTNAPASIATKSINHTITSGTGTLPATGSFVLQAQGNAGDTTGNYVITGSGGVTNSTGTYTYTMTAPNTASLVLTDSVLGEVDETLTFQTTSSGTFSSSTVPAGGTQAGSFTLQ